MTNNGGDTQDLADDIEPSLEDAEWVAADALVNANQRTLRVLEQYILQYYYLDKEPDYKELQIQLDEAIKEHERLLEDLRTARLAIERLE